MSKKNIQGSVESRVCFEQLEDWVREKIQGWFRNCWKRKSGQAGGYIVVRSTAALIAQQLFGALGPEGIRLLSAVPPTVLDETDPGKNPVPVVTSIQPASATEGGDPFTL